MNSVKIKGKVGEFMRSGTSKSGKDYCLFTLVYPKGDRTSKVTCFASNACIEEALKFKGGEEIVVNASLDLANKKDKHGNWSESVSLTVWDFKIQNDLGVDNMCITSSEHVDTSDLPF